MTELVDRRGLVLRAVDTVPGAHLRSLQRITRLAWGTLRYHVDVLADRGDIRAELDRRFLRYYPAAMPAPTRRTWDALRAHPTRRILAALLETSWSQGALADRLRLAPSTAHRYLNRLKDLGLLREEEGSLHLVWPDTARTLLQGINPTLLDQLTDGAIALFDQLDG